ncbi:MAG: TatD family hydrolase [Mariprofundaceae bacterium]
MIFDSHCHLDDPRFEHDLAQVLQRAHDQGVSGFIVPGVQKKQWGKQTELSKLAPNIYHAYGIHPWYCQQHQPQDLQYLDKLLKNAIAVGECGLDFSYKGASQNEQVWWLEQHFELALKHQLPLILHSVKSADKIYQMIRSIDNLRGVVHGFSGSFEQASHLINQGFYIGIGSRFMHQSPMKFNQLVAALPLQNLLLETDAPDGLNKQRNEPAKLVTIAQNIAKLRNLDLNTILANHKTNTQELFQL